MNSNDHIPNIVASSCATGVAEIATLPICSIKTNYQTKPLGNGHTFVNPYFSQSSLIEKSKDLQKHNLGQNTSSIKDVVKEIYVNKGLKGFYSASLPATCSQIISTSGKYTLYRFGTANNVPTVVSAIGSGIVVSIFTHPLDFIRVALQRQKHIQRGDKIFNSSQLGIKMFYRGYSKSLAKVIIGSSLFFPIYDFTKKNINKRLLLDTSYVPLLSSMISAIISTVILQPIDYIKVRNMAGLPWYQGLNPLKYLRGCSLNLFRVVPHFMITMTLTEKVYTLLQ
jgi:hypothetical protein